MKAGGRPHSWSDADTVGDLITLSSFTHNSCLLYSWGLWASASRSGLKHSIGHWMFWEQKRTSQRKRKKCMHASWVATIFNEMKIFIRKKTRKRYWPVCLEHFLCTDQRHLSEQVEGGQPPSQFVLLASCSSHIASPKRRLKKISVWSEGQQLAVLI